MSLSQNLYRYHNIAGWCNGNILVSLTRAFGSNPNSATTLDSSVIGNTHVSEAYDTGSTPVYPAKRRAYVISLSELQ